MSNWPRNFGTQAAGNVPASYLDDNFNVAAFLPKATVQTGLNYTYASTDSGLAIYRTNASAMGDTLPSPTGA